MFKSLSTGIPVPPWADDRWKRLHLYDLWLQGMFYDHLTHSFYEEAEGDRYIPLANRRPSVQFNLPRHISSLVARKLFGGRHIPRLIRRGQDLSLQDATMTSLNEVLEESQFWSKMLEAAFWGSVGAVAVTFRVFKKEDQQNTGRLVFDVWKAQECYPSFDKFNELSQLRIARTGTGRDFERFGYPKPLDVNSKVTDYVPDKYYWFVRDLTAVEEKTYRPMEEKAWSPTGAGVENPINLQEDVSKTVQHRLGFVPGVWILNMPGGIAPDGMCTWDAALNTCIEGDYTMSQLGRGIRYAAAPQLVIKGDLQNWDWSNPSEVKLNRSPANVLQLPADTRDAMGGQTSGGEASLLEMKGNGIASGLAYYEHIRKIALEQISASRKDPDKFRIPQSGRAMEVLEEEFHDLVMEQRTYYGEGGALPLLRKAFMAARQTNMLKLDKSMVQELALLWPRLYQPTPMDLQSFAQAMLILVGTPGVPAQKSANGTMGRGTPPQGIAIVKPEEARQLFEAMVDIPPKPTPVGTSVPKVSEEDTGVPNSSVSTNGNGNAAESVVEQA